jgi:hypothetical protein
MVFKEILEVFSLLEIVFGLNRADFIITPIFIEEVAGGRSARRVKS